jgi:hypothetical protein
MRYALRWVDSVSANLSGASLDTGLVRSRFAGSDAPRDTSRLRNQACARPRPPRVRPGARGDSQIVPFPSSHLLRVRVRFVRRVGWRSQGLEQLTDTALESACIKTGWRRCRQPNGVFL